MIEPALTPKQWAQFREALASGSSLYDDTIGINAKECAEAIAYNNDALPDDNPHKITRQWITTIRRATVIFRVGDMEVAQDDRETDNLRAIADALESYLPPEA